MEFLPKRATFLPERVILTLEPVNPLLGLLQIQLALRERGKRRRQRQAIESYAMEYHAEAPQVFPARRRVSRV